MAGQQLAVKLKAETHCDRDVLVLALPRGGVPVGFEVAHAIHADLDILPVRKLGVPGHEELAMGAIAGGGHRVLNEQLILELGIPLEAVEHATAREREEIVRRESLYRQDQPPAPISKRTVILVDDGLATGATMRAAAQAVQAQHPKRLIVAVPIASRQACEELQSSADEVFCCAAPEPFTAVGAWYELFPQVSDREVIDLLQRAWHERVA